MSKVIELTHENFHQEVIDAKIPVLVDFWAPWCGPCQMMAPVLDEISNELGDKIKVTKLNTEIPEHINLAMEYQIQSIPNMKLFKDGKVIKDFIGFRPKEMFLEELTPLLN